VVSSKRRVNPPSGPFLRPDAIRLLSVAVNDAHTVLHDHPGDRFHVDAFNHGMKALYSSEWHDVVAALRDGEAWAIEPAVYFLQADPRCHRSGYEKERLCRYLSRLTLSEPERRRLAPVVAMALNDQFRPGREKRAWQRLELALTGEPGGVAVQTWRT
jgi:hypothetical protein